MPASPRLGSERNDLDLLGKHFRDTTLEWQPHLEDALSARRTVVWYKNLLIGRPRDLSPLLDASLKAVSARYIPKGKEETRVLTVVLQNLSDAHFQLDSLSDLSLVRNHDPEPVKNFETPRVIN